MNDNRKFIVKVQLSLFATHTNQQVMIYNEDESFLMEADAPLWLIQKVKKQPKSYWLVEFMDDDIPLKLIKQVKEQDW